MRHVSILGDDLQTFNSFRVADYVIEIYWSVFFDPDSESARVKKVELGVGSLIPWQIICCCATDTVDVGFDGVFGGGSRRLCFGHWSFARCLESD